MKDDLNIWIDYFKDIRNKIASSARQKFSNQKGVVQDI